MQISRATRRTLIFSIPDQITPDTLMSVFAQARESEGGLTRRESGGISVVSHELEEEGGSGNPVAHLIELCAQLQNRVATLELEQQRDRDRIHAMTNAQMRDEEAQREEDERIAVVAQLASAVDNQVIRLRSTMSCCPGTFLTTEHSRRWSYALFRSVPQEERIERKLNDLDQRQTLLEQTVSAMARHRHRSSNVYSTNAAASPRSALAAQFKPPLPAIPGEEEAAATGVPSVPALPDSGDGPPALPDRESLVPELSSTLPPRGSEPEPEAPVGSGEGDADGEGAAEQGGLAAGAAQGFAPAHEDLPPRLPGRNLTRVLEGSRSQLLPALDFHDDPAQRTVMEGELEKGHESWFSTNWHARYFFLRNGSLSYMIKKGDAVRGEIELIRAVVRDAPAASDQAAVGFEVVLPERTYKLRAKSAESCSEWKHKIATMIRIQVEHDMANRRSVVEATPETSHTVESPWLSEVRLLPGNDTCADCVGMTEQPNWASSNLGVLLCIQCAGAHRHLGTDISKPASLHLDVWSESMQAVMRSLGNAKVNEQYESHPNALQFKPRCDASIEEVTAYVDAKYKHCSFTEEGDGTLGASSPGHTIQNSAILKNQVHKGVLIMNVVKATALPPTHFHAFSSAVEKEQRYAKVKLNGVKAKTHVKTGTSEPVWNETLQLNISDVSKQILLEVVDVGTVSHTVVGQIYFDLVDLVPDTLTARTLQLSKGGSVDVELTFYSLEM
eukprot:SAG11_NODE_548_length_8594_cov_5.298293_6_plen_729_part_00